ncbi:putative monovalent cation/H+ antiporter subunit A [Aidingimonas halophila]|uniref:Multisubunit sodium/proton antiporter, MrpA subunit n=1 Tax=Aidingimonas halophila TaxID=574349 RepID=A0A1H2UIX5_9GAMM|nr:putative monovalent cation/H+ antiporter subunit A [Aidingimonas halophila]GHC22700.1 Na(+)/H(+) antiporter subunit A [Aidingimonas halophila]SDW56052.1 multisubunit sodium/proton antiporter, MrpA subunit [Aidingimonas halophila]
MQLAVLGGFVLAAFAPLLHRWFGERAGLVMAILPAGLALWLFGQLPSVVAGDTLVFEYAWMPGLDITLTFLLDGLSLLFALLISVIGVFVLVYAGGYLKGHQDLARFHVVLVAFMMSMLGLVLADNLVAMFVFWELTSITSYLLIGFNHNDPEARKSALQGLFVTVGGGMALMAGLVMLANAGNSWSLQELITRGDALRQHELYLPMLLCLLGGAFTKSAQFPFHFWLPNAMAAPTPVSAYLHSATMVKAGIYLMARLHPALGGTESWTLILSLFGALTMVTGAFLALRHTGIKQVLAYSTVMALGTLTMLLGIGTQEALIAFATFLLAHSLYKGALFMVAGILDHETGTKDIAAMGGLRKAMPITMVCAVVAALSLGGIIPMLGFIGKELMLESVLHAERLNGLLLMMSLAAAIMTMAAAAIVALRPFFGSWKDTPRSPHEGPVSMLAGPATLATLSLLFGLLPSWVSPLVMATASSVEGSAVDSYLALWHGVNLPLILSLISLAVGLLIYRHWERWRDWQGRLDPILNRGPEACYFLLMNLIVVVSEWQTRMLQNGYIRNYLVMTLLVLVGLTSHALVYRHDLVLDVSLDVRAHEALVAGLMVAGAVTACIMRSRLASVAAVGTMGFCIALTFVLFSAPDLGITQMLVETLTVILLILVLFRLPRFATLSTPLERVRDVVVALATGGLITVLILAVISGEQLPSISDYMVANSVPEGHGHNIVNVILVDFRALDTLGEIFVLALAAIGVYAMLRFHADEYDAAKQRLPHEEYLDG